MSELLLELFSEEIPARMQARAADDLKKLIVEGLKAQGLAVGDAMSFATPRRLCLVVNGVPDKSPAVSEEKKGPRVGAPEQAIAGFLKGAGLASIGDATVVTDPKKGDLLRRQDRSRRAAPRRRSSPKSCPRSWHSFPWPKAQRWGSGDFQLGPPAAFDSLPARRQGRAVRGRRHHRVEHHARPSLPRQSRHHREELRGLRHQAEARRSCCCRPPNASP